MKGNGDRDRDRNRNRNRKEWRGEWEDWAGVGVMLGYVEVEVEEGLEGLRV
jgi:hypothetical protein